MKIRGASIDRDLLNREIEAELNRLEFSLSHWRESSTTSAFNRADTTAPVGVSPELLELLGFARTLSAKTRGSYDVTVAPLTAAWSYGPAGQQPTPTDAALAAITLEAARIVGVADRVGRKERDLTDLDAR